MNNKTIFISIDSSFFKLSLEFLKNIKNNYPKHPLIHICYVGLSDSQMNQMRIINSNIKFLENNINEDIVGPIMTHLDRSKFNPKVFYARFLIWSDYFSRFDKILHLDVDIFILKPLDHLFNHDDFFIIKDVYEGHDFKNLHNTDLQNELKKDRIIGVPQGSNAGVFLVTKKYLNHQTLDSLVDIKNRYANYIKFADQSIISIWMRKNKVFPSENYSYNYQFRLFFMNPSNLNVIHDAHIIHLNGLSKFYKTLLLKLFNSGCFKFLVYLNFITKGLIAKGIF